MGVTLAQARTRMTTLMGDSSTYPGLTNPQKDAALYEAIILTMQGGPGYPAVGTATISGGARSYGPLLTYALTYGSVGIREILTMHDGSAVTNTPMERNHPSKIIDLQHRVGATGTPDRWAVMDGGIAVSPGRTWEVFFYPIPSGSFTFAFRFTPEHPRWVDDSDTATYDAYTLRMPENDAYFAAHVGAAIGAETAKRPAGVIDELWAPVPSAIRSLRNAHLNRRPADG